MKNFLNRVKKRLRCNKGFVLLEYVIALGVAAIALSFVFSMGQSIRQKIISSYGITATVQSVSWQKNEHNFNDFFKQNGENQWIWTVGNAIFKIQVNDEVIEITSTNEAAHKLLSQIHKEVKKQVDATCKDNIITIPH